MRRYAELFSIQVKAAVLLSLQYRVDFFVQAFMALFWVGTALVPLLVAKGVEPIVYGTRDVVGACGAFLDKVDEDRFRHTGQVELNMAVDAARRRKVGDAWAWHRRDTSVDISPLVALTLAVHGLKEEPPRRKTGRSMAV